MLETCFIFVITKIKLMRTSASLRILVNYGANTDAIFAVMLMISLCVFSIVWGRESDLGKICLYYWFIN